MHLFEFEPQSQNNPELTSRDFINYLFGNKDVQWADYQLASPEHWKEETVSRALTVVHGMIEYCHTIGDTASAENVSNINWHERWMGNAGDIAADLNFIYHIALGENVSTLVDDRDRYDFFVEILEKTKTKKPLINFPKDIIPGETINEHSPLEELNNALRKAFILDSQREYYTP